MNNIFFRVDAHPQIGSGHLVRCEIIADELRERDEQFNVTFLAKSIPGYYEKRLINKGFRVVRYEGNDFQDLETQLNCITEGKSILIVDSDEDFYYSKEYQLGIKNKGIKLVMITFKHQTHFYADVVHNQNIRASELNYATEPYSKLLLGGNYVILNKDFRRLAQNLESSKMPKNLTLTVLLSFGGSDRLNLTERVYKVVSKLTEKVSKIIVVLGGMYPYKKELEQIALHSKVETVIYQNTDKMPELIAEADLGISSGGLTCWEFGVLYVPFISIPTSERERITADYLRKNKLAEVLFPGDSNEDDIESKQLMKMLLNYNKWQLNATNLHNELDPEGVKNFNDIILS